MEFESRLVRVLMEVGMVAGAYRWKSEAEKIFAALRAMRPDREEPFIGIAMTWMMDGQPDEAVRLLQKEALPHHPESELLRAYLALALKLSGRVHESETLAREVIATGKNETVIRLVTDLLREP